MCSAHKPPTTKEGSCFAQNLGSLNIKLIHKNTGFYHTIFLDTLLNMVKNTTGGNKHKSMARKDISNQSSSNYVPKNDSEHYAQVTKILGNGMCYVQIVMHDLSIIKDVLCHIRGKFRGKNKRHNTVSISSFVVVGLRDWESTLKNCDLIAIISSIPSHLSKLFIHDQSSHDQSSHDDHIYFSSHQNTSPHLSISHNFNNNIHEHFDDI